jgi:hypothetical protein
MGSFVLADELDEINYDFRPYVDASGTVPEPSDKQIEKFREVLLSIFEPILSKNGGSFDKANIAEAVSQLSEEEMKESAKAQDKLLHAIASLCSNQPSFAEIKKLPWRGQRKFMGWVFGVFLNPKS